MDLTEAAQRGRTSRPPRSGQSSQPILRCGSIEFTPFMNNTRATQRRLRMHASRSR